MDQLLTKLSEVEKNVVTQQGIFTHEVDGLKRMVDLYKRHLDEASNKIEDVESALNLSRSSHARIVQQLTDNANTNEQKLLASFEEERNRLIARVHELESRITELVDSSVAVSATNRELANEAMNATATSSLGPIEMFSRIAIAESALAAEIGRRKELEVYLKRIVDDMESKAPVISAQKRDYARIIESHESLTKRVNILAADNAALKSSLESANMNRKTILEESKSLMQQNADLGTQLQHLLKSRFDEQFGGNTVLQLKPHTIEDDQQQQPSSASDVISQYLLTFENVKELQQKNAQLVQVVRKLSQDQV